jgi:hypothetical protein|tara:strand:+ start:11534 stop:12088 length:555 start_codon:yes stop_codon:yes gene_type:complete
MKTIEIIGKRNIDKLRDIKTPERSISKKWQIDNSYFIHSCQISLINNLYLEDNVNVKYLTGSTDPEINVKTITKREINNKINGYKNQDVRNSVLDTLNIISLEQTIEKLTVSKLTCYYCRDKCLLLYKDTLSKKQWTLDRIVNDKGHNHDNVVICCLECNVKRGDMDSERFKRGKQIKFVRKLF